MNKPEVLAAANRLAAYYWAKTDDHPYRQPPDYLFDNDLMMDDIRLVATAYIAEHPPHEEKYQHNPLRSDGAGGWTTAGNSEGI